jgi:hypothetical protein
MVSSTGGVALVSHVINIRQGDESRNFAFILLFITFPITVHGRKKNNRNVVVGL